MNPHSESGAERQLQEDLQNHLALCCKTLDLAEREHRALHVEGTLRRHEFDQVRQELLPSLTQSVERLRAQRLTLQQSASRRISDACQTLLRQAQDVMMKILLLDRENEQAMLRRGLIPAPLLPSVNRLRPHVVSDCYRRSAGSQA